MNILQGMSWRTCIAFSKRRRKPTEARKTFHPIIVNGELGGEDAVFVEAQEVVSAPPDQAFLPWQAAFWIFNIKTPKNMVNLNWFLRTKVFGGVKADVPPSAAAIATVKQVE